jgi:hypothetical protein
MPPASGIIAVSSFGVESVPSDPELESPLVAGGAVVIPTPVVESVDVVPGSGPLPVPNVFASCPSGTSPEQPNNNSTPNQACVRIVPVVTIVPGRNDFGDGSHVGLHSPTRATWSSVV